MANFKGGFAFNNEAAKVEVEQAPDGTLVSCMNPVTGEELGGGGISTYIDTKLQGQMFEAVASILDQSTTRLAQTISVAESGNIYRIDTRTRYRIRAIKTVSNENVPFTVISEANTGSAYSFTMPDEAVTITLYYND